MSINSKQLEITETLFRNANSITFGMASVELKIHEGRFVAITYSTTENTRQKDIDTASRKTAPS